MDNSAELLTELRKLSRAVDKLSSTFRGDDNNTARGSGAKSSKNDPDVEKTKKSIGKSGDLVNELIKNVKTASDAEEFAAKASRKNLKKFQELQNRYFKIRDELQKDTSKRTIAHRQELIDLNAQVKQLGFESVTLSTNFKELRSAVDEAVGSLFEYNDIVERTSEHYERHIKIYSALAIVGKDLISTINATTKTGADANLLQMAFSKALGMSTAELIETQAEARQSMRAAGMSSTDFSLSMIKSAWATRHFTGSLADGSKLYADSLVLLRRSGGDYVGGIKTYSNEMAKASERFTRSTGASAEQFMALNKQMLSNEGIQNTLFKMDKSKRAGYVLDAANRRQELIQQGMTYEAAQNAIEAMASMQGDTAKNRLTEAAKLEAVGGAMGMSAQAKEMADIMRLGSRATAEDNTRFAALAEELNAAAAANGQGSIGLEMVQDHLNEYTKVLGAQSVGGQQELASGNEGEAPPPGGIIDHILGALGSLTDVLGKLYEPLKAMATFFLAGKFLKAINNIGGGVDINGSNQDNSKSRKGGIFGKLKNALSKLGPVLKSATGGIVALGGKAAVAGKSAAALGGATTLGMAATVGAISYGLGTLANKAFDHLAPDQWKKNVSNVIGGTISGTIETAKAGFFALTGDTEKMHTAMNNAATGFHDVTQEFGKIGPSFVGMIGDWGKSIKDKFSEKFPKAAEVVGNFTSGISQGIDALKYSASGVFGGDTTGPVRNGTEIRENIISALPERDLSTIVASLDTATAKTAQITKALDERMSRGPMGRGDVKIRNTEIKTLQAQLQASKDQIAVLESLKQAIVTGNQAAINHNELIVEQNELQIEKQEDVVSAVSSSGVINRF